MKTRVELRQERGAIVDQMKALVAKSTGRAMTPEESAQWDALDLAQGRLREQDPEARGRVYASDPAGLAHLKQDLAQSAGRVAGGGRQEDPLARPMAEESAIALAPTQNLRDHVSVRLPSGIRPEDLSFGRAMRAIITGNWRDAEAEQRVMGTSPGASGGYIVPPEITLEVLDRARAASSVFRAGARTIPMDMQELHFARVVSAGPPVWKPENVAAPASDVVLDRVSLKAKTQMVWLKMSEELARDSSPSAPPIIQQVFAEELANGLDLVALRGDPSIAGQDQPRGIKFTPNIIALPAGGPLTYDLVSEAYEAILANNGPADGVSLIVHPRDVGALDRMKDTTQQPLRPPESWSKLQKFVTTQVSATGGTGSNESEAYLGPFANLFVGMRMGLELFVSRDAADSSSAFAAYQLWIRAVLRADVAVSRETWFALISGIPAPTVTVRTARAGQDRDQESAKGKKAA